MNAPLIHLPEVDSTNLWAKANLDKLAPAGVVWTTCQTAGRGRLGRGWTNAAGQGLYLTSGYTAKTVQPSTLPLFSALAVQRALTTVLGPLDLKVKWPNDLILNGKKLVGILCEGTAGGIVSGIGTNLAQDQAYFDALNLPHGTSLVLEGLTVNDPMIEQLAAAYAEELTGPRFAVWAAEGFAPFLEEYRALCINLGRPVKFEGGQGVAEQVDEEGRLIVRTEAGEQKDFTGEVSVKGVYEDIERTERTPR